MVAPPPHGERPRVCVCVADSAGTTGDWTEGRMGRGCWGSVSQKLENICIDIRTRPWIIADTSRRPLPICGRSVHLDPRSHHALGRLHRQTGASARASSLPCPFAALPRYFVHPFETDGQRLSRPSRVRLVMQATTTC